MTTEILIVDDNADIRNILNELIVDAGYKTRVAANYNQALKEIDKKMPDVAILDVKLDKGDNDGIELLSHIKSKNKGLTLIELMIAMGLGLFLLAGAVQVLVSSKQTYQFNENLTWMQENARYAIGLLTKDIRMAGYWGCNNSSATIANTLNSGSGWYTDFGQDIRGYDGDQAAYPSGDFPVANVPALSSGSLPKSDVVIITRGDSSAEFLVTGHNPNAAVIDIDGSHPYTEGKILVISNCTKTAIFQTTGNNQIKFGHNTGSGAPGNCTKMFRFPVVCSNANQPGNPAYDFDSDGQAKVMAAISNGYYIDTASSGLPVLYRKYLNNDAGVDAEQLAQGIESIQLTYGENLVAEGAENDDGSDNAANRYVTADLVTSWDVVLSVKIHVLARSITETASEPQQFRFMGNDYIPKDNYLRQEFISTVKIRNRG